MTTIKASLVTVRDLLLGVAWGPLARGAWCRRQRLLLGRPDHGVVWLGHEVLPWAEWGAARGYFDLHHMSGLPYLMTAAGGCSPRGEVETRARRRPRARRPAGLRWSTPPLPRRRRRGALADLSLVRVNRIPSGAVRHHVHHLDDSLGRFNLEALDPDVRADPAYWAEGHCAVTLAK